MNPRYRIAYNTQKHEATKKRNIPFLFTFPQWIEWWGDDIDKRGQRGDSLCMCRYNDTGPYHPDNVYKDTRSNNTRMGDTSNAYKVTSKPIKTPYGIFKSRAQAARVNGVTESWVQYRLKVNPTHYYYL